jgi:Tol biopolymer transport system component/tRNA A-37 threonylcarbamoyl transferase component Bud32
VTTPERWQQIERLYHAALTRDEDERAAFLRDTCGDDTALRREVESVLAYDGHSAAFLTGQAIDTVAATSSPEDIEPLVGQRIGPYEITSLLGFGGMGDVYRARDARLGREVAIKMLPDVFASDPARRARFEREARVLAALNHPNIAAIYGLEDAGGIHALVLELVEGETLAQRLRSGPLPVREALSVARQLASALEAAHDKGIVHRDLKPRNIALTQQGVVKVLDFGLAKAALDDSTVSGPHEADTRDGTVLGTTTYMSPEQARGKTVDAQTDVWAFGCVLVEMLTGHPVFSGETVSDTIAAILDREPDWSVLPPETPAAIARLVKRCLEKDPTRRLHDAADARIEIDDALQDHPTESGDVRPPVAPAARRRQWLVLAAAIAAAVALGISRAPKIATATRLSVSAPGSISPQLSAVVSPDGRRLAFVATGGSGNLMLWIRDLDSLEPRALAGTENAAHPFWSPDGRFIGFLADGKVRRIATTGGAVATIADTAERAGPSWSRNGQILFVSKLGELGVVSAEGGPVSTVVAGLGSGRQATWPHFLPDARHFLFFVRSANRGERGVYVGSLDSSETKQLLQSEFKAAYAGGHLLFVRGTTLMAQPFDTARLELTGHASPVADGVWVAAGAGQASFSVSDTGVLAYVNAALANSQFAWFDRSGRVLAHVGRPARYAAAPQLARDGRRLVVSQGLPGSEQIWLLDAMADTAARMTYRAGSQTNPVWSGDGKRIAFQSRTDAGSGLYLKNADGTNLDQRLYESDRIVALTDWSPDGGFLVFTARGAASLSDIWVLPLSGDRQPRPFLETAFNKTQAQVSPDGRWIAYTSYESGRDEVYVESFPLPGHKQQVSSNGGVQPRWGDNGLDLFYVSSDQRLMAVPIQLGHPFRAGAPATLFRLRLIPQGSQSIGLATLYDVSPDGQRFLCVIPPDESAAPMTVVLNWTAALAEQH